MKVCVVGAGVSGLAVSSMLFNKGHDVTVYEKNLDVGGIARTKKVGDATYHMVGGHCFNSKFKDVLDFVFSIYPKHKWNSVERKAKIFFKERFISYPIEFSIREIAEIDLELAKRMVFDLINAECKTPVNNLSDWFVHKFGKALAESYFIPYNRKIWGMEPSEMSFDWVKDKLPNPNIEDIIESLLLPKKDDMPHANFYYPCSNDQMDFIRSMCIGQKIKCGEEVLSIKKSAEKWVVNDCEIYDVLISTVPLNMLPRLIEECPENIVNAAGKLNYNSVTTMLWESEETDCTWTYFPEENTIFHRHIHIGNFLKPNKNVIITEALGKISRDIMKKEGERFPHLIKPIDYHVSDHAYVVYDKGYFSYKNKVVKYLEQQNLFSLGRFGEWEYYNMDVCIKSALELAKKI